MLKLSGKSAKTFRDQHEKAPASGNPPRRTQQSSGIIGAGARMLRDPGPQCEKSPGSWSPGAKSLRDPGWRRRCPVLVPPSPVLGSNAGTALLLGPDSGRNVVPELLLRAQMDADGHETTSVAAVLGGKHVGLAVDRAPAGDLRCQPDHR